MKHMNSERMQQAVVLGCVSVRFIYFFISRSSKEEDAREVYL